MRTTLVEYGTAARRSRAAAVTLTLALAGFAAPAGQAIAQVANPQQFDAVFSVTATIAIEPQHCPALTVHVTGTGHARHLGEFTAVQRHCLDPAGPDPLAFTNGIYTWTNASGDAIRGRYAGRAIPTATTQTDRLALIDAAFTITGGTGRLAGARGGAGASGLLNIDTGGASVVGDGEIHFREEPQTSGGPP
jgi:hypothetical protein